MQEMTRARKRALRERVRLALKGLGPMERAAASAQARARLREQVVWQEAQSMMGFAPLPEELDIWPLVKEAHAAGKKVILPRFAPASSAYEACVVRDLERDIEVGHFGIREPRSGCPHFADNRLDLILVPGVAFDLGGHRLGRGKGYYDKLLAALQARLRRGRALPTICGVAFDEQVVEQVPAEAHDVHMDCILTSARWIEVGPV